MYSLGVVHFSRETVPFCLADATDGANQVIPIVEGGGGGWGGDPAEPGPRNHGLLHHRSAGNIYRYAQLHNSMDKKKFYYIKNLFLPNL